LLEILSLPLSSHPWLTCSLSQEKKKKERKKERRKKERKKEKIGGHLIKLLEA